MRSHKHSLHPPSLNKKHLGFSLEAWQRRFIYFLFAALSLSGGLWLIAHYFLRTQSEFGESIHPWEHPAMQAHAAFALALCIISGSLIHWHIKRANDAACNRKSGWTMVGLMLILLLSGYGLLYLANDDSHAWWSLVHWVIGLGSPALLWLHIVLGRRAVGRRTDVP